MKTARGLALLLVVGTPACILFGIDDLTGGIDAGTTDAAANDASSSSNDAIATSDAALDAGSLSFSCTGIDATFCDAFDRDAAIVVGAPWNQEMRGPGCTLAVDGTLISTYDASTGTQLCYLETNAGPTVGSHFQLDFDMSYVTDVASTSEAVVAQIFLPLATVNDGGILSESVQLKIDTLGTAKLELQFNYPDAAASPVPGDQYPVFQIGGGSPFTQASSCHITLSFDSIDRTASATATCGANVSTTTPVVVASPGGFAANPKVLLGYVNPAITSPTWSITYDNMVFRASP